MNVVFLRSRPSRNFVASVLKSSNSRCEDRDHVPGHVLQDLGVLERATSFGTDTGSIWRDLLPGAARTDRCGAPGGARVDIALKPSGFQVFIQGSAAASPASRATPSSECCPAPAVDAPPVGSALTGADARACRACHDCARGRGAADRGRRCRASGGCSSAAITAAASSRATVAHGARAGCCRACAAAPVRAWSAASAAPRSASGASRAGRSRRRCSRARRPCTGWRSAPCSPRSASRGARRGVGLPAMSRR